MRVKWGFILILALASNNLSVFSPQGPTEGCGVIPDKGRCMCTGPDPGGSTLIASSLHWNFILNTHRSTVLHDTTDFMPQGLL